MSDSILNDTLTAATNRRQLLKRAGVVGAMAVGTGILGLGKGNEAEAAYSASYGVKGSKFNVTDVDILNFALNLEYLEAEFYQRAAFGTPLSSNDSGVGAGNVVGGTQVPFVTPAIESYAKEIATDELNHVRLLRAALGSAAVTEPAINFTATFTALALAAGVITAGQTFNPFDNETDFLLGSFIFEDVGVTAYHGAAPYIKNPAYLSVAAGILAVEAYHAGEIRTLLFQAGATAPAVVTAVNKIAVFRDAAAMGAAGNTDSTDQGVFNSDGSANIIPTDQNSLAFARTFAQVLNIVYGSTAVVNSTTAPVPGAFFPNGLSGRIK